MKHLNCSTLVKRASLEEIHEQMVEMKFDWAKSVAKAL